MHPAVRDEEVCALDLAVALRQASWHADDLVRDLRAGALAGALVTSLEHASALCAALRLDLGVDRDRSGVLAREIAQTLAVGLDRAGALAFDLNRRRDHAASREHLRKVGAQTHRARRSALRLAAHMAVCAERAENGAPAQVSGVARWVIGAAAGVLPGADRLRYLEEFQTELHEVARTSRAAQWMYAVRLMAWAPLLRRELRRDTREAVQGP